MARLYSQCREKSCQKSKTMPGSEDFVSRDSEPQGLGRMSMARWYSQCREKNCQKSKTMTWSEDLCLVIQSRRGGATFPWRGGIHSAERKVVKNQNNVRFRQFVSRDSEPQGRVPR
jgi:hypothetical protein